ncbi:N-acetylmuramoyl-L-alanine amidase [Ancylobacter dichloromethanicus]|uniref:N-acetylmuramoyl-L-alanine amidase n=1 Tax=Ancylobacter dichloromethanicus TaxID=518825 RepID=A0A9W6MXY8_9HYPH|nr:N-acetylmuramoyl-L-alanine amidase [Ancylobacter dichloromethanicus]MBS7555212.1 N-acetylmuramoyl-L-alanine amidase [Ancylobacter dichloromethanicus]GLK70392.1 N-acetylmuramoyl-L-alanine amidase [Ancylobacter dichloromethanicus]
MTHTPDAFPPDSPLVAAVLPSPNHGARIGVDRPDMLLLHYTGMESTTEALAWLRAPERQVSAHYVVLEDGRILQLVPEARRAWHAGAGFWAGASDINSLSIGIEIANPGHDFGYPPFPAIQIEAVTALAKDILSRHRIPPDRVLAHSDVAPSRKNDPGEKFPWDVLHRFGVGHLVEEAPPSDGRFFMRGEHGQPIEALQAMLALYGYGVPVSGTYCETTEVVVRAFQRHFRRARIDGIADVSTLATLYALCASRPEPGTDRRRDDNPA